MAPGDFRHAPTALFVPLLLFVGSSCRNVAGIVDHNLPDARPIEAGPGGADSDTDADADADGDADADADADADLDAGFVLDGSYASWPDPGGTLPEDDTVPTVGNSHTGWLQARCFECHGVGKVHPPSEHPAGLQYWAWSCARGLPGQACHGHGVNGAIQFNHGGDPYFAGCTRDGCHTNYMPGVKDRNNHGFMKAPDPFCNACHDIAWTGWPDGGL